MPGFGNYSLRLGEEDKLTRDGYGCALGQEQATARTAAIKMRFFFIFNLKQLGNFQWATNFGFGGWSGMPI